MTENLSIDSSAYRVRGRLGLVEVTERASNRTAHVQPADFPCAHRLAAMTESEFDAVCADALGGS